MSIPKVIHYCWFGKGELPNLAKKCIESWKEYCPEYEIIQWDESNFDINSNRYVKEAYEAKKYAFVSDYVRLYVLYNYGGIYMDTDVEVLKPLDYFLDNKAFSGFETKETLTTSIIGSIRKNEFFKLLLSYYDDKRFIADNGKYDMTTNVEIITKYCLKYGLKTNNEIQSINGFVLYPIEYFSPKDYNTGKIKLTKNTYTIHHFSASWINKSDKFKQKIIRIIGPNITNWIVKIKKIICG